MQKLLQLPVNAVNIVKTVQSQVQGQGQEEDKSPVLTPDGAQQTWYNALQPDELRHLRSGGTGGGGGSGGGGDHEERAPLEEGGGGGGGSFQTQPLRYGYLKKGPNLFNPSRLQLCLRAFSCMLSRADYNEANRIMREQASGRVPVRPISLQGHKKKLISSTQISDLLLYPEMLDCFA